MNWKWPNKQVSMLTKRVRTGLTMGLIATLWIFSGNWVFSIGFAMQAVLAQLEYYRMAMQKGEGEEEGGREVPAVCIRLEIEVSCVNSTPPPPDTCRFFSYHNIRLSLGKIPLVIYRPNTRSAQYVFSVLYSVFFFDRGGTMLGRFLFRFSGKCIHLQIKFSCIIWRWGWGGTMELSYEGIVSINCSICGSRPCNPEAWRCQAYIFVFKTRFCW